MSEKARSTGEWGRGPRWAALGATLVFTLLPFAFAASASAATNPVGSGTTTLHLSPAFSKSLKKGKVKLSATSPATLKGTTLALPLTGGALDSDSGQGAISQSGELKLKAPHGKLFLKGFTLKTTRSPLIANVSGAQLQLTSAPKPHLAREGFGFQIRYPTLKLSKNLAERLNKKLHLKKVFSTGEALGSLLTRAQPQTIAVAPTGDVALEFNSQTFAKLNARDVAINPVFPAEHIGNAYLLPIHGGQIAPDASLGTIETQGTVELIKLGSGAVQLREIWPELGPKALSAELAIEPASPVTGGLARPSIGTLSLVGCKRHPQPHRAHGKRLRGDGGLHPGDRGNLRRSLRQGRREGLQRRRSAGDGVLRRQGRIGGTR